MRELTTFFAGLRDALPRLPVTLEGRWTREAVLRHTSAAPKGSGLHEPVVDGQWEGTFACEAPLAGLAFLANEQELYWAKSAPPAFAPTVRVASSAYAGDITSASFTGSFLGAYLPSFPATVTGTLLSSTLFGPGATTTGDVYPVATLGAVVFGVVLIPAPALSVGRNRLWRLREEIAVILPADLRRIMTERRSGRIELRSGSD